jgi:hypothetical protein
MVFNSLYKWNYQHLPWVVIPSRTYDFVSVIGTIKVAVTAPVQRDTSIVFDASEFGLQTSDVRAVKFIRTVLAVIVSVTHPKLLDTLSVTACKLIVPACFIWEEKIISIHDDNTILLYHIICVEKNYLQYKCVL